MTTAKPHILPAIVVSQLAGGSLWFAGNAVLPDLQRSGGLPEAALGQITTAVLLGFIAGTLVYSWLAISDRYSPRKIFLISALLGALMNAATWFAGPDLWPLLILRFATGFFLAGIYPVGMKIAAGWFDRDLGKALGWLVSALVMGTALPHLIRALGHTLPWQSVMLSVSVIAASGGVLMYTLVPDGPHLRSGARFDPAAFATIFRSPDFRASAFGYFGHMWELYAFWAFVPAFLVAAGPQLLGGSREVSFWSFVVIAAGAAGCVAGGYASRRFGSARVAFAQLGTSGICCLLSPLAFALPYPAMLAFLVVWGITVAGDSPQFSALNAQNAPRDRVGSALTIVNCIGFAITIVSIQLLSAATALTGIQYLFVLVTPGPVLGLLALMHLVRKERETGGTA
ncbi:MAG: MFS transporter [Rhodobiaceae bacterium]|nr:MFS transporter [Rhodobiaceae bacterium]MCC0047766.1 MFS transporter [Rhodobiaceae bacterium]